MPGTRTHTHTHTITHNQHTHTETDNKSQLTLQFSIPQSTFIYLFTHKHTTKCNYYTLRKAVALCNIGVNFGVCVCTYACVCWRVRARVDSVIRSAASEGHGAAPGGHHLSSLTSASVCQQLQQQSCSPVPSPQNPLETRVSAHHSLAGRREIALGS